jgi:hypothetical protein
MLIFYLCVFTCIALSVRRVELRPLNWMLARMSPEQTNGDVWDGRLARLGEDLPIDPDVEDHAQSAVWLKLLTGLLVFVALATLMPRDFGDATPPIAWVQFAAAALIGAWYIRFVWSYEITVGETEVSETGLLLRKRRFPLDRLTGVSEEGPHALRLSFEDGRTINMYRHVRGRARLARRLNQIVRQNNQRS